MRLASSRPYASLGPRFEIAPEALDVANSAHETRLVVACIPESCSYAVDTEKLTERPPIARPVGQRRARSRLLVPGIVVITRMPLESGRNVLPDRGATVPRRCRPKGSPRPAPARKLSFSGQRSRDTRLCRCRGGWRSARKMAAALPAAIGSHTERRR
jgi:hypothetical protein